jgi:hypothetical protein
MTQVRISSESAYGKALAEAEKPYVYRPYPTMLYRAKKDGQRVTLAGGGQDIDPRCMLVVHSEEEEAKAKREGWRNSPQEALDFQVGLDRDVAQAAAERNWDDRNMSEAAKAESAEAEAAAVGHLGEIPEKPRRRGRQRKVKVDG